MVLTQLFEDSGYQLLDVELWNTLVRFMIFPTVVLLLDRVRRENILFTSIGTIGCAIEIILDQSGISTSGEPEKYR